MTKYLTELKNIIYGAAIVNRCLFEDIINTNDQNKQRAKIGAAIAGGALGAAAGGIIGMAAGTAGMIGDMYFMNQAYDEQRDFKIDMFNYNLQNIQALPYTLTKVAAYTANNKIFPMVEYYTCKEVEKQALRDKLKYNGMTVMIIGTIDDYINQNEKRFIKGQIIRIPTLTDDGHIANEIYNEINKGVYI